MWSLFYLVIRTLVRLIVIGDLGQRDEHAKDLEILVLRHQLRVLQRTASPPRLRTIGWVLLAAASRVLPRGRWVAFCVTPATLLRWHREQDPVDRPQPRWAGRPLQHPELVAEDEDLEVLRVLVALTEISDDDEANESPDDKVEERPHRPMVPRGPERESGFPTT